VSTLRTVNLCKRFGGLAAVEDVSVAIQSGKITSIIGPNGAGKTTLFNLIAGFLVPDSGDIWLDDRRLTGLRPYRVAAAGVSRSFQLVRVFPQLSVLDNILLGYQRLQGDSLGQALLRTPGMLRQYRQKKEEAKRILENASLASFETTIANDISYGQQKLVELGRAFAARPKMLMLDEPMAGLSMVMIERMISLIRAAKAEGIGVAIIEHNMQVVMDISDTVVTMNFGKVLAAGTPAEVCANQQVIDAYMGCQE
jgi:branched-chain amino acid transport system ATP-binding protein